MNLPFYSNLINYQIKKAKRLICNPKIKVVSFDIFDTLLIRPIVNSQDLYCLINLLISQSLDLDINLIEYRKKAYYLTKKQFPSISDIWSSVLKELRLSKDYLRTVISIEERVEERLLYPRKLVKELYQLAKNYNKRIVVTSDMYLSEEYLKSVLIKNGYNSFSSIYVSCECDCGKQDGTIYNLVLQKEKINGHEMLHIGDSFSLDFKAPTKLGIKAVYIPSNIKMFKNLFKISVCDILDSSDYFQRFIYGFAINSLFETEASSIGEWSLDKFAKLFVFPLVTSISLNILNRVEIQKTYQEVYFVARDGFLPLKAYTIFRKNCFPTAINGKYLYASRKAYSCLYQNTFYDYAKELNQDDLTIEEYIKISIVSKNEAKQVLDKLSLSQKESNIRDLSKTLHNIYDEVCHIFNNQKNACKKYYQNILQIKNGRILVFDCGYNGSIALALKAALNNDVGVDKIFLLETPANRQIDSDNNTITYTILSSDANERIKALCEYMLSSSEGTCLGFVENESAEPVLAERIINSLTKEKMKQTQQIALTEVEEFSYLLGDYISLLGARELSFFGFLFESLLLNSIKGAKVLEDFWFEDEYLNGKKRCLSNMVLSNKTNKVKVYKMIKKIKGIDK